ncbi:MAG: NADH-ubiquinone oxidoreductase-F iron-sulfur binding region domain-containing protein [Collinsella sp.]|nr:NADH-ubiquinone oxidoreductase-F iron-sulfur binding region domain-containing protein [Collinsella sp.]
MRIVNFMPVHRTAPVSLRLLEGNLSAAGEALEAVAAAEEVWALVPSTAPGLASSLAAAAPAAHVVEADPAIGFVYLNDTAALKLIAGEKPIPSAVTGAAGVEVITGEELLGGREEKLVWLDGADGPVSCPRVATARALIEAAGADADAVRAVYLGYPQGALITPDRFDDEVVLTSDYARLLGPGSCPAQALSDICGLYRAETCGRCVYGHEGSHQLNAVVADICRDRGRRGDVELMRDLAPVMATQSLCEMGRIMGRTVMAFIEAFGEEIELHYTKRTCRAGECAAFMTYHILPARCVGCTDCLDACEEDAIAGRSRFVHVIDQKACTRCGDCVGACDEGAIVACGAEKPRTPPRPIPVKRR